MTIIMSFILIILSILYFIDIYYHIHKRILFYEEIDINEIYEVHIIDNGQKYINILSIDNVYNEDYADIKFNFIKYNKVPFNKIYNIVNKYDTYKEIYNALKEYKQ
jgi:hypothetical protein